MATKKPMKKPVKRVRRFQEGGEADLKAEGLAASNKDAPLGFFESLRRLGQGNIDQEGSEAYKRYGAGRGRMERAAASEFPSNAGNGATTRALAPVSAKADAVKIADAQGAREMDEEMYQRGRRAGAEVDSAERMQGYKPLAAAQNAAILAAKPSRTASSKTTGDFARLDRKALLPSGPNVKFAPGGDRKRSSASAEELAASLAAAKPTATTKEARQAGIDQAFKPPSAENTQKGLEAGTLGAVGAGSAALAALLSGALYKGRKMYKAGQAAKEASRVGAEKRAILKKRAEEGIDANLLDEFQGLASSAAKQSKKTDVTPKNVNPRSVTGSAREDAKADRFRRGLDELSAKQMAEKNLRERGNKFLFADDAMKRGGRVKKMASGGSVKSSVSSASRRGDGIAQRGKTRGKMY